MASFDDVWEYLPHISTYQKILTFNVGFFALISGLAAQLIIFQFYESVTRCTGALDEASSYQNNISWNSTTIGVSAFTGESCNSTVLTQEDICGTSLSDDAITCNSEFCEQIVYAMDDTGLYSFPMEMNLHCDNKWLVSFIPSMIAPGQLVSGIFCGNLADRYGRKKTLILSSIACGIITFCSAFVDRWYEFLPLKVLTGFFDNIGYMASVAYAIEILGPSKREWSNYVSFAFGIGFFLSSPVAYYWSNWRQMTIVLSIFYFIQIPLMMYCPPSPKWQFSRGDIEGGFQTLEIFEKKTKSKISPDLKERFRENVVAVDDEPDSSIVELGKDPLILRLSILCSTVFFLVGVAYNGTSLGAASLPGNLYTNNLINSILDALSAVVAFLLMPKMTRRLLIGSSFAAAFGSCLMSAILFEYFPKNSPQETVGTWISFAGKFAISVAFSSSYVYISEIFPTSIRGAGMGLVSILEGLAGFFAPYLAFSENYAVVYSLYAVFSLAGCAAVWALPETLNRQLPQTISEARVIYRKEKFRISSTTNCEQKLLA